MTETPIRILVADDHTLLREALCEVLRADPGLRIVAQAGDGDATVRMARAHRPDVVLLDIEMPNHDPPATVRRLLAEDPGLRIIVLSMYDGPDTVQNLLALGVCGYLHKSATRGTLVSAIRAHADDGPRTVTLSVSSQSLRRAEAEPPGAAVLSAREAQVLAFVAEALSNRQIGSRLGITEGTVKRHLRNIYGKLEATSRIDAVNKAEARGLIAPRPRYGRAARQAQGGG